MKNIWHQQKTPLFILAPMEAVTDIVFRKVVDRAARPDMYFTEFTNATGWVNAGDIAVGGRLDKSDDEQPIIAQLWGGVPEDMAALAKHCKKSGYDGIDINMGCPDKSAIKSGGGAALITNPELARSMIAAAKTAELPVSVKTRLGYSSVKEYEQWLGFLLEQDISALTIHLRTKREMSKVPAHWDILSGIVDLRDKIAPQTMIIANGDIRDRSHGQSIIDQYHVDGVMIGRGVFNNPFAFEKQPSAHTKEELVQLLRFHLDLYDKRGEKRRKFETLKRFFKIYIRDFEGAGELRNQLMQTRDTDQVRTLLDTIIS